MEFIILIILAIIVAYLILIFPGRAPKHIKETFAGVYFANRGLHHREKGVPENSMAAFRQAVESGYGILVDARITSDNKVVAFHDSDLKRMTGVSGAVEDKKYKELKELNLSGTEEGIPLLEEVLDMVAGRVPVMVLLHNSRRNQDLCNRASGILRAYKGPVCVASFHPGILTWFRGNCPQIFRGLFTCQIEKYDKTMSRRVAYMISRMLANKVSRPQFIAFRIGPMPWPAKLCYAFGALRMGWTCRKPADEGKNRSVIFEGYLPELKKKI